jgi:arylsulfatase A-like enzyme
MADDHSAHAISAYGSRIISTPNIDRLAEEGMRFTNCFNVNSLCAPSRAVLITGKYNHHNGFIRNGDTFDGSQLTFPKLLQAAGYETGLIGKWHLKSQPSGFNYYSVIPGQGQFFDPLFKNSGKSWEMTETIKGYLTDIITDKAIAWMERQDADTPFCLMIHHKAPHTPHLYPQKYENLFANEDLPVPENFWAKYQQRGRALYESQGRWSKLDFIKPNHFIIPVPDNLKLGTKEYKAWSYQTFFKGYFRLVAALDDNIGRLLDYLDKSGLAENTVVIYTSDNGFFLGDFGLFNKMWMYEESLRLPLLVRYPGKVKANTVNENIISILDFAPTILDYARAEIPDELQGQSFRSILMGNEPPDEHKAHYYHYYGQYDVPAHYGLRTLKYKLIHYYEDDSWELYDIVKDPRETRNIYNQPERAAIIGKLKTRLEKMRLQFESTIKTDIK